MKRGISGRREEEVEVAGLLEAPAEPGTRSWGGHLRLLFSAFSLNCSASSLSVASCFDCSVHRVERGCPTQSRVHVLASTILRHLGSLLVLLIRSCERAADWPGSEEPSTAGAGFCGQSRIAGGTRQPRRDRSSAA